MTDAPKRGDIVKLGGREWKILRAHRALPGERGPFRIDIESTRFGNILRDLASSDVQR